ncbi:MAG TPA: hypothetical protein VHO47_02105 [Candidatus Babeliales bacterium]|nr:hypothetical protein [Candidatus Babeliales bacterium]
MRHSFLIACGLLSVNSQNFAYKISSADVVNKKLGDFGHFIEKTDIVNNLAGKEMETNELIVKIDSAIKEYVKEYWESSTYIEYQLKARKSEIVHALLQDSPEALKELEKQKTS